MSSVFQKKILRFWVCVGLQVQILPELISSLATEGRIPFNRLSCRNAAKTIIEDNLHKFEEDTVMLRSDEIAILANNIKTLENSSKNIKCPGVLKKRRRRLRNLQK